MLAFFMTKRIAAQNRPDAGKFLVCSTLSAVATTLRPSPLTPELPWPPKPLGRRRRPWLQWQLIATVANSRFESSASNQMNSRFSNRNKNALSGITLPSPCCSLFTRHSSLACPDEGRITAFLIANPTIRTLHNSRKSRHIQNSNRQLLTLLNSISLPVPFAFSCSNSFVSFASCSSRPFGVCYSPCKHSTRRGAA
jgi:hypothetical protein